MTSPTPSRLAALNVINDHVAPIWDTERAPSESDLLKTLVLSVPLSEASAKVRDEGPIDEDIDLEGPHWAGVVPLTSTWGDPVSADDLFGAPDVPAAVTSLAGNNVHPLPID